MKTWFRLIGVLAALSFLSVGYATAGGWEEKYRADLSWLGADINSVIRAWGPPTSVYTAPNGERTFSWIEVNGTTVTGKVTRDLFGPSVNVESQSHENSCQKLMVVGSMRGNGLWLDPTKEKDIVVVAANNGTPAGNAGVEVGDIVLAINGQSTKGMKLDAARKFLYALEAAQAQISLTLKRKNSKEPVTATFHNEVMHGRVCSLNFKPALSACYP